MTIRTATLRKYGEKNYLVVDSSQSTIEVIELLKSYQLPEERTFLIVSYEENYGVILFTELVEYISLIGYAGLYGKIGDLPIPPANKIVPKQTSETGIKVVEWVAQNRKSSVIVTDGKDVIGLLCNKERSSEIGLIGAISLLTLHGEIIAHKDPRYVFESKIPKPKCPSCGKKDYFKYISNERQFICRHCNYVVRTL